MPNHSSSRTKRRPSDILAIIGFIIIGVIIIWGLVHAARLASPWFNSLFTKPTTVKTQPLTPKPSAPTTMPLPVLTQPAAPTHTVVTPKAPTSPADLPVRIMSITADPYGNGMVEFDIANVGGSATGVWYFEVNLPTEAGYVYFSPPQKSLAAGDHIANTIQFSQLSQSGGIVSVQVDPANLIHESSESNNYASQPVGISYAPQYTY